MSAALKVGDKVIHSDSYKKMVRTYTKRGVLDCISEEELETFNGILLEIDDFLCEVQSPDGEFHWFAIENLQAAELKA